MLKNIYSFAILLSLLILSACVKSDPGPLAGTWAVSPAMFETQVQFRPGEIESGGQILKVSYEVSDNKVTVTTESGPEKGGAVIYTITGDGSTAKTGFLSLKRLTKNL